MASGRLFQILLAFTEAEFCPKAVFLYGTSQSPLEEALLLRPLWALILKKSDIGGGASPWSTLYNKQANYKCMKFSKLMKLSISKILQTWNDTGFL